MLKFIALLGLFLSVQSFASTNGGGVLAGALTAGGSGGGGVLPADFNSGEPQIIFNIDNDGEVLNFAHAKLVDQQWQIQKIQVPAEFAIKNEKLMTALELSAKSRTWVQLQTGN